MNLSEAIKDFTKANQNLKEAERVLEQATKMYSDAESTMLETLRDNNISEISTEGGETIKIAYDIKVSMPSVKKGLLDIDMVADNNKCVELLKKYNCDNILKTNILIEIPTGDLKEHSSFATEIAKQSETNGLISSFRQDCHYQTLKKTIKELIENNAVDPADEQEFYRTFNIEHINKIKLVSKNN